MTNPLDPEANYDVPKGDSKYMQFEQGNNEFLPLDAAIVGFEYWTLVDGKNVPVRLSEMPEDPNALPDAKKNDSGDVDVKHFWAFPVWDYLDCKVKVLEITQKGIMKSILSYTKNEKWGSPTMKYSFTVNKDGEGLSTKYETMANPATEIPEAITVAWENVKGRDFDLNRLLTGGDPFSKSDNETDTSTTQSGA